MSTSTITKMLLEDIHYDDEFNCRGEIIPMDVIDLAKDIEKNGLLQPVVAALYSIEKQAETGKRCLLVAGYRRYTAYRVLKKKTFDCKILPEMSEVQARFMNLSENTQRKDLNVLQEARAIKKLKDLGVTEVDAAEQLGKSRGWVQLRFILLKLPEDVQDEIASGMFTHKQIRDLYTNYKGEGRLAMEDVFKKMKNARLKGGKTLRAQKKNNPMSKHRRLRGEVFKMMAHVREVIGNGLATRALAWSAGEINAREFFEDIQEYDELHGEGNYVIPDEL